MYRRFGMLARLHEEQLDLDLDARTRALLRVGCEVLQADYASARIHGNDAAHWEHGVPPEGAEAVLAGECCEPVAGSAAICSAGGAEGLFARSLVPEHNEGPVCTLRFLRHEAKAVAAAPLTEEDRVLAQVLVDWLSRDLRRWVEKRSLEVSASMADTLLTSSPEAIVTVDTQRRIVFFNPAAEALFGYASDEVMGQTTEILYADPDRYVAQGRLRYNPAAPDSGRPYEMAYRRKDGSVFVGETLSHIARDAQGEPLAYIGSIRDVSERVEQETTRAEFVSTFSAELRAPVTAIRGSLGLVAGGVGGTLEARGQQLIEIASRNCEQLLRLVSDVETLQNVATGELRLETARQPLGPLLHQAVESTQVLADRFSVTYAVELEGHDLWLEVDAERFLRVLDSLLANAARVSPVDGEVVVRGLRNGSLVRVEVHDQGAPIPYDFRPFVFERFARVAGSHSASTEGTGLGLAVSKSLVEAMGGHIDFESPEDGGTCFYVEFPERSARHLPRTGGALSQHVGTPG